ncbi:MAG TPA: flavin reductase family protein [Nannocystis exedens]|nr:flavin reductase family protein [Nannocystis exedens]
MPSAVTGAELNASSLSAAESYRLMTSIVAPRPIAWVSTVDGQGRRNLAPFSYFQGICSHPPTIMLGLGWNPDGSPKDTLRNILETRELVVCHVSEEQGEMMVATSAAFASEVSEWQQVGIRSQPSIEVAPPRVAESLASMECVLRHAIPIGVGPTGAPSSTLVIAEVVHFALADGLVSRDKGGRLAAIDPAKLRSLGRLGGITYTTSDSRRDIPRPSAPEVKK